MNSGSTQPWRRMFARVASPFRHAVSLLRDVAAQADLSIDDQARWNEAIGGLLVAVIRADGRETPKEVVEIETLFTLQFGKREAQRVKEVVAAGELRPIRELCETLTGLSAQDRAEMIRAMLEMAAADDAISSDEIAVIGQAAEGFGFDGECVARFRDELSREREKRSAIVKSGAGIAVAVAVIAVFVFAATFLKSVIFGLILAYLFWPLQRFYQHRFFPHPWIQQAQRVVSFLLWPIHAVAGKLKQLFASGHSIQHASHDCARRVSQACHATLVTVLGMVVLAIGMFLWASSTYVASVGRFVANSPKSPAPSPAPSAAPRAGVDPDVGVQVNADAESDVRPGPDTLAEPGAENPDGANLESHDEAVDMPHGLLDEGLPWLERYRPYLARSTLLRTATEVVEQYLTDEQKKKELAITIFQNLQPVLIRAGGLAAMLGSLLLDILMTMFFFSFFLQRIASGQSREGGLRRPTGQYFVETIFNSGWLPNASPAARREGQILIGEVITMMKTWLRGYLWIIAIDTVLYTTIFMLLGIPYSPVLGLIAGLTILLPFIGPVVSCALTLIVTLALYSQSVTLLVTIIVCYLFIHGVLEQLILYPALVGEALGLNALETIIIVLLGGLVSGLAGAVFAVPVAAILKYLIPKIYQTLWRVPAPQT